MKNKKELSKEIFKKLSIHPKGIFVIIILLLAGYLIGWRAISSREGESQLQTTPVERGMIISSVSASGQIVSSNKMDITTQASGIIKKVYVQNGDAVKKGDKILEVTLDQQGQQKNTSAWSSYLSAKNSLDSGKTTLYTLRSSKDTAWKKFYDLATNSTYQNTDGTPKEDIRNSSAEFQSLQADWLAAEAKYQNQQAVIDQAQMAINNAWLSYQLNSPIVTAPMEGTITGLSMAEGMTIGSSSSDNTTSSQRIAVVQTEAPSMASFNLSEIDVSQVNPGQKATITLDSFPDKTYTGKVVSVNKVGAITSGVTQYPAIIQFDIIAPEILPNMSATANIIINKKENVLLVPSSAVQTQDSQSFVEILKNNQSQLIPVEIGLISDTQTEIVSGLNEGDLVITGSLSSAVTEPGRTSPFGGGMGGMMRIVR